MRVWARPRFLINTIPMIGPTNKTTSHATGVQNGGGGDDSNGRHHGSLRAHELGDSWAHLGGICQAISSGGVFPAKESEHASKKNVTADGEPWCQFRRECFEKVIVYRHPSDWDMFCHRKA